MVGNKNSRQAPTMKVFAEDSKEMAIGSYMPAKPMNLAH